MLSTSLAEMTASWPSEANSAIFLRMSEPSSLSERHRTMSGWMPMRRSSLTECCVGLVFSSPAWPVAGARVERGGTTSRRAQAVRVDVRARGRPACARDLPDRLQERQRLDVAHRAADLGDDHVDVR